jgi:uncharacterized membrane protein
MKSVVPPAAVCPVLNGWNHTTQQAEHLRHTALFFFCILLATARLMTILTGLKRTGYYGAEETVRL